MTGVRESTAALRHRLRTPLNHILGYSEMLLEQGAGAESPEFAALVRAIQEIGRELTAAVQNLRDAPLPGASHEFSEDGTAADPESLRAEIARPVEELVRRIGELLQAAAASDLPDVLRIASASAELLAFSRGTALEPAPVRVRREIAWGTARARDAVVLVVDDDEANRDLLSRQLERLGFTVIPATTGEEAVAKLEREEIDIAAIDFMMPGMDGLDVLEAIKNNPRTADIPVLMISALDELTGVSRCIERGADDYLFKPFDSVILTARIGAALERARLRQMEREHTRELERTRDELERSNEDLKRFAYAASHDLQAPLRTITTHLQLLERRMGAKLAPEDLDLLRFPVEAALRMNQLVRDLLTYSQFSTDERITAPLSCEEVLAGTLRDLAFSIKESSATITHDPLPVLVADATELRQLFLNLVGNAIKYRRDLPPAIHVGARREFGDWHFTVADNGLGIPAEHIDDVFKLFRRLHGHERPGTGLGLAICKRIVERIGGQIWVESTAGVGSTFHFTIPDEPASG